MKTVYFVRHGESEANLGFPIYQGEESPLTEKGKEQAQFIAKRCAKLPVEIILSSNTIRARETAHAISKAIRKEVEIVDLFTERRMPSELLGKPLSDTEAETMELKWLQAFYDDTLRVGDGENFADLKARAHTALRHLEQRSEVNILVITHGYFLRMILAAVIVGESLTPTALKRLVQTVRTENTGLTVMEFRDEVLLRVDRMPFRGWIVRVWNDHAHLG